VGLSVTAFLLGLSARWHDLDNGHVAQVGIVRIVEAVVSDQSLEIIDVPCLRSE
jgi:hypothetical protein